MQDPLRTPEPPNPPVESCRVCGKPSNFQLSQNWFKFHGMFPDEEMFRSMAYVEIPHQECYEKILEIQKKEHAELERAQKLEMNKDLVHDFLQRYPSKYRNKTLSTFAVSKESETAFKAFTNYTGDEDFGILLIGAAGIGKTHLVFGLINKFADQSIETGSDFIKPSYYNLSELLSLIRRSDFTIPTNIYNSEMVFLDDLGTENITDWSREIIYRIFEARSSREGFKTFVTTNLSLNELRDRLNERTVSRILDCCVPIEMHGKDMRKEQMKKNAQQFFNKIKGNE